MELQDDRCDSLERLRREAEREMRRNLDDVQPRKRPKLAQAGAFIPVDRYRYAVVQELEAGAKGFLITCNFRKEKSATREATQLLRRYLPDHLFPPPPPEAGEPDGGATAAAPPAAEAAAKAAEGGDPACGSAASLRQPGVDTTTAADGGGTGGEGEGVGGGPGGDESEGDGTSDGEGGGDGDNGGGSGGGTAGGVEPQGRSSALALAKVGCCGVVLMRLSAEAAAVVDPVRVVEAMLADCEAGRLQPPVHCQRITPLDSTCALTPSGLTRAIAQAAAAHSRRIARQESATSGCADAAAGAAAAAAAPAGSDGPASGGADPPEASAAAAAAAAAAGAQEGDVAGVRAAVEPFTFSVVYHSRFTEQPPGAGDRGEGGALVGSAEQDADLVGERSRIISLVAAGMSEAFGEAARVDLKKPQVAVLVEAVPVAGRPLAGVVVLREHMFIAKGKLLVKPLARTAAVTKAGSKTPKTAKAKNSKPKDPKSERATEC